MLTASLYTIESFFQFQPRTLGSLFSSNGSSRTQKLLTHKIGYTNSHKLGGFSESLYSFPSNDIMSKGTCSVDDASSVVDAPETSESASSSGHSLETKNKSLVRRDKQHQDKARAWSFNGYADSSEVTVSNGEMAGATKSSEPQQTCQGQGKANTTTQCVTSTSTSEMTANALSESAEECFANGMDSFVSKPVTFKNLKEYIEQYLVNFS